MSGQNPQFIQDASRGRLLDFGPIRAHNRHVQNGRSSSSRCQICSEGLAGLATKTETIGPFIRVAESDRGDEEGSASSAPGSESDSASDAMLWP